MASRPLKGPFVITVEFDLLDDGSLFATCDQVPGFVLCHANHEAVFADVVPALECILSEMYGVKMKVERARELGQDDEDEEDVLLPAHMCRPLQYVGHSRNW